MFAPPPNPEPDFESGSAPTPNLGLDLGQVLFGSGPNPGSEPDCSITMRADAKIDEDSLVFMETSKGVVEVTDSVVSM